MRARLFLAAGLIAALPFAASAEQTTFTIDRHTFTFEIFDFLEGIRKGKNTHPDFREGAQVQAVLDAVVRSSKSRSWQKVETIR